jgi:hypothetical protein
MKMLIAIRTRWAVRVGLLALLMSVGLMQSPRASADSMLFASTDLVAGSSADTFSFHAPSAGTVTAQIANLAWPLPLASLSFSTTTSGSNMLASWTGGGVSQTQLESFQVGPGTYFAHINATAAGSLDLGLYSLLLTFNPSAVPLPAAAGLLMIGLLIVLGLSRTLRGGVPGFETDPLLRARA